MKDGRFECIREMLLGIAILLFCVLLVAFGIACGGGMPGPLLIWGGLLGGIGSMIYTVNAYLMSHDPGFYTDKR